MKKWAKFTLIFSSVILSFGALYGGLYIAYSVESKKHKENFNENVKKANETIESWKYEEATFDSISSLNNQLLTQAVTEQIKNSSKDIICNTEITNQELTETGKYTIEFTVNYSYKEEKNWKDSKTFTKTVDVKDFTSQQYALWTLEPVLVKSQLSYREYKSISVDNINNYIEIKNPVEGINYRIEPNVLDYSVPTYIDNNRIYVDIYVENPAVLDAPELHKTFDFGISILPPIVLTNDIVLENFAPDGIWANKKVLKYSDYSQYDYIDSYAFDDIELDELELPSDASILHDQYDAISFPGIKKISIVKTNEDTLFIKDNVVYSKDVIDSNEVAYSALTISDRTLPISELKLFDQSFMNALPENKQSYNVISNRFYQENIFTNVQKINLENSMIDCIGDYAFTDCQKLNQDLKITNSSSSYGILNYIGSCAFANTNITSLTINNNTFVPLLLLNDNAFSNNKSLQTVNILYSAVHLYVGKRCFANNGKLATVNMSRTNYDSTLAWNLINNLSAPYTDLLTDYFLEFFVGFFAILFFIIFISIFIMSVPTITISDSAFDFVSTNEETIVNPIDRTINITGNQFVMLTSNQIFGQCHSTTVNIEDWINVSNNSTSIQIKSDSSIIDTFKNVTSLNIKQFDGSLGTLLTPFNKECYKDLPIDQNLINEWK